jgi:hypothetical protein
MALQVHQVVIGEAEDLMEGVHQVAGKSFQINKKRSSNL